MDAVETVEFENNIRLEVYYDFDPLNPREEWDHAATMLCAHSRYTLGDEQMRDQTEGELHLAEQDGVITTCGKCREPVTHDIYSWIHDKDYEDDEEGEDVCGGEEISPVFNNIVVLPLYLIDHSGISMSVSEFSCPWDSGQVGVIYMTHDKIKETFEVEEVDEEAIEKAKKLMVSEVEEYDMYLTGEIYQYAIIKTDKCGECDHDGEEVLDSCGGFFGLDHVMEEGKSAAEHYSKAAASA